MRRFFVPDMTEGPDTVLIKGGEFAHLKKVLRLKAGDSVRVFNGKGLEVCGRINALEKDTAIVGVEGVVRDGKESPVDIILFQALLKGDKPDFVVQKAVELGVKEIVFYSSPRTVPSLGGDKIVSRLRRWNKVAVEATKQCGRAVVPPIGFKASVEEAFEYARRRDFSIKIALHERDGGKRLKDLLANALQVKTVALLAGPEGGFSDQEAETASSEGFFLVKLGPRVFRAETAAMAALSVLQYGLGDF